MNSTSQKLTQHLALMRHFRKGRSLTPMQAIRVAGTMKLSTRVGELRRLGHDIQRAWVELPNGKRVKRYWLCVAV